MAKMNRERRVKEKRALKQEKKDARKQLAADEGTETTESAPAGDPVDGPLSG